MIRVISSPFTFILKFLFPAVWIAVGLYGLLVRLVHQQFDGGFFFICLWLAVSLLIFGLGLFPLKKVSLGDDALLVSNFIREVDIPLSEIEQVEAVGFGWFHWTMPRIIIKLKSYSLFGKRIQLRPGYYFKDVIDDLNKAVERKGFSFIGGRA